MSFKEICAESCIKVFNLDLVFTMPLRHLDKGSGRFEKAAEWKLPNSQLAAAVLVCRANKDSKYDIQSDPSLSVRHIKDGQPKRPIGSRGPLLREPLNRMNRPLQRPNSDHFSKPLQQA